MPSPLRANASNSWARALPPFHAVTLSINRIGAIRGNVAVAEIRRRRALPPLGALAGAVLVAGADILANMLDAPAEMPIGVLTAALGALFSVASTSS